VRSATVPRARTLSETRGFMKTVIDAGSDSVLGFAMVDAHAGEIVAVVLTAMWAALPYSAFRNGIIAHPTMAGGSTCCSQRCQDHDHARYASLPQNSSHRRRRSCCRRVGRHSGISRSAVRLVQSRCPNHEGIF